MTDAAIDLSRLPAPTVVEAIDYETVLAALKADLVARWPDYTADLESDPAIKLLEVAAYREVLLRQRVNDAARAVLVATAIGSDLDHLGALLNVARLEVEAAAPNATPPRVAVMEGDERFRQRIVLALEGYPTAGSRQAYRFHTLSASSMVKDVSVASPAPGLVRVTILSTLGDGSADAGLIATVRSAVSADKVRPLTDSVSVVSATVIPYAVAAELRVRSGPDPDLVRAEALAGASAYVADRHAIGAEVAVSGLLAALHQPGCRTVALLAPATDLIVAEDEAPYCTGIDLTVTVDDAR